MNKEFLQNYFG